MIKRDQKGFSFLEFVLAISMALIVIFIVTLFAKDMLAFNSSAQASLSAQLESRKILKSLVSQLRSASPSAVGAYSIETAATNTIIFFADVNEDGDADRVRFFLDHPSRTIQRGIVLASGAPPSYNLGSETLTTMINDVSNGTSTALFTYYDTYYAGTSSPLALPINITLIRMVGVTVHIDDDPTRMPATLIFTSKASLRNLKDNL